MDLENYLSGLNLSPKRNYTSDYGSAETTPEKQFKKTPNGGQESKTNLIVNYLPPGMKTEVLKDLFSSMGEIEHVKLCKNKESRVSLGFGFVKVKAYGLTLSALCLNKALILDLVSPRARCG